jgi:two-component system, NtrC family, nitrogen regulation sensor histidine kinase GlnL
MIADVAPPALRVIFDALPNPVIVFGADDQIVLANGASEDFFQSSAQQLVKQALADLVPFASPVIQCVHQVRQSGGMVNEYAVSVGTPRYGGERSVDVQSSPVPDVPGHVVMMILRRSMAQKLDLQLSHQGAARSVSGMASMLAHEIKNPLAGIRGAAQLLEPTLTNGDRALARLICDETDRIRDLVDQMEVFTDERPPGRKPVNIHIILDRVKQLIDVSAFHGITLKEDYDPSLPPVHGNHDQLVQVFLNLAKNAAEAIESSGTSGEIILTTAFRPGVKLSVPGFAEKVSLPLEVCVHDDGPQIPAEMLPHIFDPFVTSKPAGRGLGLALVAKLVRDHGGVVECVPRDRGKTFRILLPLIRGGTAPETLEDQTS